MDSTRATRPTIDSSAPPVKEPSATPTEITAHAGRVTSVRLSPLQQVATWFAAVTGAAVLVVVLVVVADLVWNAPRQPTVIGADALIVAKGSGAQLSTVEIHSVNETLLADYKAMSDAHVDRGLRIVDSIAVRVLWPVLTLLLGYIFGARLGESSS